MSFRVSLVDDAENDLLEIYFYVLEKNCQEAADKLIAGIEEACGSFTELPLRGHKPPELSRVGVSGYREIRDNPYRTIYRVAGSEVLVHCILGGRRDLQDLFAERLLRKDGS